MDSAQSLLSKAPPADLGKNLKGMQTILMENPDSLDALTRKFQIPFETMKFEDDYDKEKAFLLCRYNKVGEKYRSPWTNQLHNPKATKGTPPTQPQQLDDFQLFESKVNDVWEAYKNLYYGADAVSSVYLVDKENGAMQGMYGIQKECPEGTWNSVSLVFVEEPQDKTCHYRVETSVLLIAKPESEQNTHVDISAFVTKEVSKTCKISQAILAATHIENLGTLIEANEIDLRSSLERVEIPKMQEVMDSIQKNERKMPTQVNPIMGMMMDSKLFKRTSGA